MSHLLFAAAASALTMAAGVTSPPSRTPLLVFEAQRALPSGEMDLDSRRRAWDTLHLLATLQGAANRSAPRLYVELVGGGAVDRYWLGRMREPGQWLADAPVERLADPVEVVRRLRRWVRGAVVWDERVPATANVASTIAGVERAIALRYDPAPGSLYQRLVVDPAGPRLRVVERLMAEDGGPLFTGGGVLPGTSIRSSGSAKCDAYRWAMHRYLETGRCDPVRLAYYPDAAWLAHPRGIPPERTLLCNQDWFVARRAFFFDLGPWDDDQPDDDPGQPPGADATTLRTILACAARVSGGRMIHVGGFTPWDQKYTDFTGRKYGGVPTEWRYAEILSCFNAYMDADAPGLHAMANASIHGLFPLKRRYPQSNLPTTASLKARGYLLEDGSVAPRAFCSIYVGDYDSASWLYQRVPDIWDDPVRGSIPLGWAVNPNLAERFAFGINYIRRTASPNDTFLAGDSGAGYLNPGNLVPPRKWSDLPSGLAVWEAHCRRWYARFGLIVTGFVIDGNAPGMSADVLSAYARFSPGGVVAQKVPRQALVDGVAFLRMGPDLTGDAAAGASSMAGFAPRGLPSFSIFRTILWSPAGHRDLYERIRALRPDVEVVEPNTLLELLRRRLVSEGPSGRKPSKRGTTR